MNSRVVQAIIRKDLTVVFRSKSVALPMMLVPLLVLLVLPVVLTVAAHYASDPAVASELEMDRMISALPASVQESMDGFTPEQQFAYVSLVYVMAPLFLLIPCVVVVVVAADSFAGEKERKTLEALLYTPTTDSQLFWAKVLSACVPAILVVVAAFLLYVVVANAAAWSLLHRVFFPTPMWIVLVFWMAPAVALLGLGATVLVSSKAGTFQAAYQLGSLVVLPIVLMIVSQVQGLVMFDAWVVALMGLVLWIAALGLVFLGARTFKRTKITPRL